jgi:hypothetical protein
MDEWKAILGWRLAVLIAASILIGFIFGPLAGVCAERIGQAASLLFTETGEDIELGDKARRDAAPRSGWTSPQQWLNKIPPYLHRRRRRGRLRWV